MSPVAQCQRNVNGETYKKYDGLIGNESETLERKPALQQENTEKKDVSSIFIVNA